MDLASSSGCTFSSSLSLGLSLVFRLHILFFSVSSSHSSIDYSGLPDCYPNCTLSQVFQRKNHHVYAREVAIHRLKNFQHPNILQFIYTCIYPNENHIVFEYHMNGSLYDLLKKRPISLKEFCDLSVSASQGMSTCISVTGFT